MAPSTWWMSNRTRPTPSPSRVVASPGPLNFSRAHRLWRPQSVPHESERLEHRLRVDEPSGVAAAGRIGRDANQIRLTLVESQTLHHPPFGTCPGCLDWKRSGGFDERRCFQLQSLKRARGPLWCDGRESGQRVRSLRRPLSHGDRQRAAVEPRSIEHEHPALGQSLRPPSQRDCDPVPVLVADRLELHSPVHVHDGGSGTRRHGRAAGHHPGHDHRA